MARKIHKISKPVHQSDDDRERYFEEIYRAYFSRLYAYSRAIVDSQSLAKDIVSDLFYRLWNNKTDLLNIGDLEMYLFVSVKNLSIRTLKKNNNVQGAESLNAKIESIDYVDPEELLLEKELLTTLERSISNLPDQCQLVFELSRDRGMKNAEIAKELGISVVTVKSQLRKAQLKLRADIIKFYHDKDDSHFPDMRLIGQYLLAVGFINYEFTG